MGHWISILKVNEEVVDEDENIRRYEEQIAKNAYGYGFQEEGDKSVIKWWQWLIYDMRARIVYAIILGLLLGLAFPLIYHFLDKKDSDGTIYGSCLINNEARLQCLINQEGVITEKMCTNALCCWHEGSPWEYKCYHSFPSAYQYELNRIANTSAENGQEKISLYAKPNHANVMTEIQVDMMWETNEVLNIELFDPAKFPNKNVRENSGNIDFMKNSTRNFETGPLTVVYGSENSYFYFQVIRHLDNGSESLFDTRLGPIHSHNDFTSFSTVLPTKFVYGLKGGQSVISKDPVTYGAVNGFENAELPFYMVQEKTGDWHAVLLETVNPFMAQLVNLPAVLFHIEGSMVSVNLKIFVGPKKENVLLQVRNYLEKKANKKGVYIPPYWGLGLHLCRKETEVNETINDISNLLESAIPYDSDCIDENLRNPFEFNYDAFPTEVLEEVKEVLINATKRLMLVQNLALPESVGTNVSDHLLVLKDYGSASTPLLHPFRGSVNNITVMYPNVFHEEFQDWLDEQVRTGLDDFEYDGMILSDNFPKNENTTEGICSAILYTKLASLVQTPISNETWSSLCYDLVHTINSTTKNHLEVHNVYGHQALVQMATVLQNISDKSERFLLSGSSSWTESFLYGSFSGMQVPFTWDGMKDSLSQILRHFILFPFSGTPICGSYTLNATEFDSNLCLRWFQLGLVLPFARHTYRIGELFQEGPLEFNLVYRKYLINTIQERYTLIPYYYTLFYQYRDTAIPPVRPMSYEFDSTEERNITFGLADQFMIGSSIMAAPILTRSLERYAYFPRGAWYELDGNRVWSNIYEGGVKIVVGHITQTPLFLRGGHIIPILRKSDESNAELSRSEGHLYSVLVTPPLQASTKPSEGLLYVDDGISVDSKFDLIEFNYITTGNLSTFSINTIACDIGLNNEAISTTIDQVKVFGFTKGDRSITITIQADDVQHSTVAYEYDDDISVLNIHAFEFNWCINRILTITISLSETPSP